MRDRDLPAVTEYGQLRTERMGVRDSRHGTETIVFHSHGHPAESYPRDAGARVARVIGREAGSLRVDDPVTS